MSTSVVDQVTNSSPSISSGELTKSDIVVRSKYHIPSFYDKVIRNRTLGTVFDCHRKITTYLDNKICQSTDDNRQNFENNKLKYFIDTSFMVYKYHEKENKSQGCRQSVVDRYRDYVDPVENPWVPPTEKNTDNKCPCCGSNSIVIDESISTLLCNDCGMEKHMPLLQARPSYKTTRTRRPTQTQYKRENHFNDWLTQIQAKESISVPEEVYDMLKVELTKRRNKQFTQKTIRTLMRKLGLNKYYEHIPRIIQRLQGTKPPNIDHTTEERLRTMFKMIQDPFDRHSPQKRKNFLSYAFVLRKFVGLLGLYELQVSFPLLKSRTKLYQQDRVWCKICKDLNWHFEPSL